MAGVAGWWDEDPGERMDELAGMTGEEAAQAVEKSVEDNSPFHDIDEKVLSQLQESGAEQHLAELDAEDYVEPLAKKDVEQAKVKVTTAPAWISVSGGTITNATTLSMDYVNLTGQDYRRFQEYEKAFKKLTAALDQLTPKVMGLPHGEYKTVKKELELVAKVMVEAQQKGLR